MECPGAVILVKRELAHMATKDGEITDEGIDNYLKTRKGGLTKAGIRLWAVMRVALANVPLIGGPPLLDVDENDEEIALPPHLQPK